MTFKTGVRAHHALRRVLILFVMIAVALVASGSGADAARKKKSAPKVERYASIVIDADSGFVLSEKHADKKLHPASLTKMMTLYLTFEALDNGTLQKNSRIRVSKHAAGQEPSKLGLTAGSTIRVEDAILALVTKSANDAAATLAEAIGGSEAQFASLMTRKAKALGMVNTRFTNASGLHQPSQVSTARDMALLSLALMRDHPRHYKYFSTASFTFAGKTYRNHNHLMKTYKGMDGLKTGYVYASGYNLAASAVRDGRRLIGVVFGGRTAKSRNDHMAELLDAAFLKRSDPRIASQITTRENIAMAAALPARKPSASASASTSTTAAARGAQVAAAYAPGRDASPQFDAMGLVVDIGEAQGDADIPDPVTANRKVSMKGTDAFVNEFKPRPLNTDALAPAAPAVASAQTGGWSVQVGAFATREAGMNALQATRGKLPSHVAGESQYAIAPLMTNRGVIYRARLSGLGREQATQACRILQGNCLILASR
jgi:D-alanyl-D-alanine carboxypeptidase